MTSHPHPLQEVVEEAIADARELRAQLSEVSTEFIRLGDRWQARNAELKAENERLRKRIRELGGDE